jgi:hypothetical protein
LVCARGPLSSAGLKLEAPLSCFSNPAQRALRISICFCIANGAFLWKAALLALALANVALQHANRDYAQALADGAVRLTVRLAALGSILMWLSVLIAGRWIGFV